MPTPVSTDLSVTQSDAFNFSSLTFLALAAALASMVAVTPTPTEYLV
jgi:hypothetical protein